VQSERLNPARQNKCLDKLSDLCLTLLHLLCKMPNVRVRCTLPILVKLNDNSPSYISNQLFNELLAEGRIIAFKRSTGDWIDPSIGPMRELSEQTDYTGPERRSRW
jgi:hypothetical protein